MDGYDQVNIIKVVLTQALLKWERADISAPVRVKGLGMADWQNNHPVIIAWRASGAPRV